MIAPQTLDLAPEPRLELRTPNDHNAFTNDFLNAFDDLDEPASNRESEIPGPWKVFQEGCTHAVFPEWANVAKDEALGTFLDRSLALRFWAALAAHEQPRTFACREENGKPGLEVVGLQEKGFDLLGTIDVPESARLVSIFEVIEALARSPFALALVLESAGGRAIGHIGEILIRRARRATYGTAEVVP